MTYSCALFDDPDMTLPRRRRRSSTRSAASSSSARTTTCSRSAPAGAVFAIHAAGDYGCRVTTTTISREQHARRSERVREAGLADRVEVLLEDYRDLRGRYDKLVSVEMIEAVGWQYFDTFFHRARRCSSRTG